MTEVCSSCQTISGRRSRPRPPKLATAADIVIGTAMKTCKGTSHTLIRGPGGRQNYFKPKWHYLVLAASGVSDQDVWGVFERNFSWRFLWHHRRAVADFGGRRYRQFIPFNFLLSLAAPLLHGVLVLVTGNKFFTGVVVTGDNCSPVSLSPAINLSPESLSPAINCSPVSTTPAITENPWQRLIAGVSRQYIFRWCRWQRWAVYHRCRWHRG